MNKKKEIELSGFIGSMMGTALGDSLGALREGSSDIREILDIWPRYTDDTAMMIGIVDFQNILT